MARAWRCRISGIRRRGFVLLAAHVVTGIENNRFIFREDRMTCRSRSQFLSLRVISRFIAWQAIAAVMLLSCASVLEAQTTYTQQRELFGAPLFGTATAISSDGTTAIVGEPLGGGG